jgi:hypothetical protein
MNKLDVAIGEGRGLKELTCDNLGSARVRLRKDPTKHRDGIPRFLFELHPSHKLPKINAKGKPFRSRDLDAMFDQY